MVPWGWNGVQSVESLFSSVPLLSHPDPSRQFVVEVDASDVGVSMVLSQRDPADQKLQPCAFFNCRLTPSKVNYDIGNRELLAVILSLQEGRHWLEGSAQPFVVWYHHTSGAQRGWTPGRRDGVFRCCFKFSLTCHNVNPYALSCQFSPDPSSSEPGPILRCGSCLLAGGGEGPRSAAINPGSWRWPTIRLFILCSTHSCNGAIPPNLPVTPGSDGLCTYSGNASGGPPHLEMPRLSSRPAQFVRMKYPPWHPVCLLKLDIPHLLSTCHKSSSSQTLIWFQASPLCYWWWPSLHCTAYPGCSPTGTGSSVPGGLGGI